MNIKRTFDAGGRELFGSQPAPLLVLSRFLPVGPMPRRIFEVYEFNQRPA
jgi:hypothetical protein